MDLKPPKKVVTLTLDAAQWAELMAWIESQGIGRPKKNAMVDLALKDLLEKLRR